MTNGQVVLLLMLCDEFISSYSSSILVRDWILKNNKQSFGNKSVQIHYLGCKQSSFCANVSHIS